MAERIADNQRASTSVPWRRNVWLVFPPLLTNNQHPEVGVPELTANLRAAGHVVRQRDLNVEFIYDYLTRPATMAGIVAWLQGRGALEPGKTGAEGGAAAARWWQAFERVADSAGLGPDRHGLAMEPFLEHERRRTNRPGRPDESWIRFSAPSLEGLEGGDDPDVQEFLRLCVTLPRFWATFADIVQYVLTAPRSFQVSDVLATAEAPLPLLDDYYDELLAEAPRGSGPSAAAAPAPDIVGVSLHGAEQLAPALRLLRRARERWPAARLVAGGPMCTAARSLLPRLGPLFDVLDVVVVGGGVEPLLRLCDDHERGEEALATIPGVALRRQGEVTLTAPGARRPLDALALPEFADLPLRLYPEQRLPVRLHCGCTWGRCRFCYHVFPGVHDGDDATPGAGYLDRVVEHVGAYRARFGIRNFTLLDHEVPLLTLEAFAERLIARGLDIEWDSMARFEREMTPERCALLYRSGGRDLFLGLETVDERALRFLRKGVRMEQVEAGVAAAASAGFRVRLFLLNYPGQSIEELERTVDWAVSRVPAVADVALARFALARGTAGWDNRERLRVVIPQDDGPRAEPDLDVFDVRFEAADEVPFEAFKQLWIRSREQLEAARAAAGLEPRIRQPGQAAPRELRAVFVPFVGVLDGERYDFDAAEAAAHCLAEPAVAAQYDVEILHELDPGLHGVGPIAWRVGEETPGGPRDVLALWWRRDNVAHMAALLRELESRPRRPFTVAVGPAVAFERATAVLQRFTALDAVVREEEGATLAALLARLAEPGGAARAAGLPGLVARQGAEVVTGPERRAAGGERPHGDAYRARTARPRRCVHLRVLQRRRARELAARSTEWLAEQLRWAADNGYRDVRVLDEPLDRADGMERLVAAADRAEVGERLRFEVCASGDAAALAGLEVRLRRAPPSEPSAVGGHGGADGDRARATLASVLSVAVLEGKRPVQGWTVRATGSAPGGLRLQLERGGRVLTVRATAGRASDAHAVAGGLSLRFTMEGRAGGLDPDAKELARRLVAALRRQERA